MPNTIADNLQRLVDATDAIGQAIIDAGGTVNEYDRLEEYPADIKSINRNTTSIDITENGSYYAGEENTITTTSFPITIQNSVGTPMKHVTVEGNMQQNGTPTTQSPIQPKETGERTGNLTTLTEVTHNGYVKILTPADAHLFDNIEYDTEYTLSWEITSTSTSAVYNQIRFLRSNSTSVKEINSGGSFTLTSAEMSEIVSIAFYFGRNNTNGRMYNIMLNAGSSSLPYEPWGIKIPISSASTTTPVYLGEVETTRKVKKLVLTGQENWIQSVSGINVYRINVPDYLREIDNIPICTHYKGIAPATGTGGLQDLETAFLLSASGNNYYYIRDDRFNNANNFKSYLAQQYAAGTPVTVWYVLAKPTTGIVNEPIRKIGDYVDTVSADIKLPLSAIEPNIVDVDTSLKPSSASFTYNKKNDYIGYNEINVNVPNTYTVEDEGKVVDNATLVTQTTMPTEITANDTYDTTLYNSIVVNVPTGGSSGTKNDVTFYDYDGTIVTSYTKDEFANLTALPANPTHEGLTAQGWNWSLSDAKTYVNEYGKLDIGQMYVTDDGKTRVRINLIDNYISPTLELYLEANSEVDIDWGDGSAHSTFASTDASFVNELHSYPTSGDYNIIINVISGGINLNSNGQPMLKGVDSKTDKLYRESLYNIEIGNSVTSISSYAFNGCYSLSSITIPDTVADISQNAFYQCYSLSSITIPDSVTSIGLETFNGCYSLSSITIPDSVTSIGQRAFNGCYSLSSITIPDSVTSISSYAFNDCYSLSSITIPDSVTSIDGYVFNGCYSLLNIYVADTSIPTGSPWGATNTHVNVVATRHNNYQSSCTEVNSGTTLTGTVNATVGDLVVATFEIFGSSYSISEGWTLLGDGTVTGSGNFSQKTGMAYKIATSTTESFTITQNKSTRAFVNMISITGASIGSFSGYTAQTDGLSITMNKPNGLTIWSVSTVWWGTGWNISKDMGNTSVSTTRNLLSLDQSYSTSVTFTNNGATSPSGILAASLTITGIDNFWYYDNP